MQTVSMLRTTALVSSSRQCCTRTSFQAKLAPVVVQRRSHTVIRAELDSNSGGSITNSGQTKGKDSYEVAIHHAPNACTCSCTSAACVNFAAPLHNLARQQRTMQCFVCLRDQCQSQFAIFTRRKLKLPFVVTTQPIRRMHMMASLLARDKLTSTVCWSIGMSQRKSDFWARKSHSLMP